MGDYPEAVEPEVEEEVEPRRGPQLEVDDGPELQEAEGIDDEIDRRQRVAAGCGRGGAWGDRGARRGRGRRLAPGDATTWAIS